MKTLRVTLEIDVVPLSKEAQDESVKMAGLDEEDMAFDPDDYSPQELADIVEFAFDRELVPELFAGSDIYVTFDGATAVNAEWVS